MQPPRPDAQPAGTPPSNQRRPGFESENLDTRVIEARLKEVRSMISDLGQEIDSHRAITAGAMGGGVFLLLLAAGAIYDLITGKTSLWLPFGITRLLFYWVAGGLAAAGSGLVALAMWRDRRRDRDREARLAELEQEFSSLLDRKEALSGIRD